MTGTPTDCHRPGRWWHPTTGRCEHPDHDLEEANRPDPMPLEELTDAELAAAGLDRASLPARQPTLPPGTPHPATVRHGAIVDPFATPTPGRTTDGWGRED